MALNLVMGVWHVHGHRIGAGCINLACAGFICGLNIFLEKGHKRHREMMRILEQTHAEQLRQLEDLMLGEEALEKARTNLEKVIIALKVNHLGPTFYLHEGQYIFGVSPNSVHKLNSEMRVVGSTCIQSNGLPGDEVVASLLLLLHYNPNLFDCWARQDGLYGAEVGRPNA